MNIKILTDTSCGMSREEVKSLGYEMIALPFVIDEKEYDEDSIARDKFYELIKDANEIHTSQASLETLEKKLDEMLITCDHVIYLPITSGLSGSFQSANVLLSEDKYKDKVTIIDHRTISVLQKAMMSDVANLIKKGFAPKEIKEKIEANSGNHRIYIAVDTLDYLKKGGRVSALAATVGNLLSIKPILFSDGGKFDVVKKVRSIKAAEEAMIELTMNDYKERFSSEDISHFSVGSAYTKCIDEENKFVEMIKNAFGTDVMVEELPLVVGCHIGEGAVAMALYKHVM